MANITVEFCNRYSTTQLTILSFHTCHLYLKNEKLLSSSRGKLSSKICKIDLRGGQSIPARSTVKLKKSFHEGKGSCNIPSVCFK